VANANRLRLLMNSISIPMDTTGVALPVKNAIKFKVIYGLIITLIKSRRRKLSVILTSLVLVAPIQLKNGRPFVNNMIIVAYAVVRRNP